MCMTRLLSQVNALLSAVRNMVVRLSDMFTLSLRTQYIDSRWTVLIVRR